MCRRARRPRAGCSGRPPLKPGRGAGYHSSDSYRSYQVAEGSIGPAQSVDSFIRDGQSTFVITGDTLGYNGIAVPSWGVPRVRMDIESSYPAEHTPCSVHVNAPRLVGKYEVCFLGLEREILYLYKSKSWKWPAQVSSDGCAPPASASLQFHPPGTDRRALASRRARLSVRLRTRHL